ncbi:MAG: DNA/RNA non-specific endonuclease [Clostridia bacterium]|nr:DNA/RNA non-specific endonuclease [Clostridia bacterium]
MKTQKLFLLFLVVCLLFTAGCTTQTRITYDLSNIPEFDGYAYVELNNNIPSISTDDFKGKSFEKYAPLDHLGRCGTAYACIGKDTMPADERGSIGQVKPTGWQTAKYEFVDGKYLYNRCHLIGYQLTGENANEKNLITGTRYLNTEGMLPFENKVAEYVKETGNHVLYRVTPIFESNNLVANGVVIEAISAEDGGKGISFNIYCYNAQPRVIIDYATGENYEEFKELATAPKGNEKEYVINKSSKKFHLSTCSGADNIKKENKETTKTTRSELIDNGYSPCKSCIGK